MSDIVYSDLSRVAMTLTKKFLAESDLTPDDLAYSDGQAIIDLLAIYEYIKKSDFADNLSVMTKNNAGNIENVLIELLETAFPVNYKKGLDFAISSTQITVGSGQFYLRNFFSGIFKIWAAFAAGTGNGCLNGSSLSPIALYYVYLIENTAFGTFDIFVDIDDTNIPTGYTKKFTLGGFYTDLSSLPIIGSDIQPDIYDIYGINGLPFEKDYLSNVSLTYVNSSTIQISACLTRDSSNLYNQKYYSIKNEVFILAASTVYYLFQTSNKGFGTDYEIDTNIDGSGLTAITFSRIGQFKTDSSGNIIKESIWIKPKLNSGIVYGYLALPSTQTLAAGVSEYIDGTFTNSPFCNFELGTNSIVYKGEPGWFKIDVDCSAEIDTASSSIIISANHKASGGAYSQIAGAFAASFFKNVSEIYNLGFTAAVYLETDDEIQLMIESSNSGDITFNNYTTIIHDIRL